MYHTTLTDTIFTISSTAKLVSVPDHESMSDRQDFVGKCLFRLGLPSANTHNLFEIGHAVEVRAGHHRVRDGVNAVHNTRSNDTD